MVFTCVDFYHAGHADELRDKLARARATVELRGGARSEEITSQRLRTEDYQGRTWVKRIGVKVDRVACAWLPKACARSWKV
jgi:restriction endonuclease Mrr